jgi:hypothetical protein
MMQNKLNLLLVLLSIISLCYTQTADPDTEKIVAKIRARGTVVYGPPRFGPESICTPTKGADTATTSPATSDAKPAEDDSKDASKDEADAAAEGGEDKKDEAEPAKEEPVNDDDST